MSQHLGSDGLAPTRCLYRDLNTGAPETRVAIVVDRKLVYGTGRVCLNLATDMKASASIV